MSPRTPDRTSTKLLALAAAALGLTLLAGCGKTCGPSTCTGCCDATNTCQSPSTANCGQSGGACVTSSAAQVCQLGVCTFASGSNGGNGSTTTGSNTTGSNTTGSNTTGSNTTGSNTTGSNTTGSNTTGSNTGSNTTGSNTGSNTTGSGNTTGSNTTTSSSTTGSSTTAGTTGGSCDGSWILGQTFYTCSNCGLGEMCSPSDAPQNCPDGSYIIFDNGGGCYCAADCNNVPNAVDGTQCDGAGQWHCHHIYDTNGQNNSGFWCVADSWNLCSQSGSGSTTGSNTTGSSTTGSSTTGSSTTGSTTGSCVPDGFNCETNTDCCTGTCDFAYCGTSGCGDVGAGCGSDSDCCSGTCDTNTFTCQ